MRIAIDATAIPEQLTGAGHYVVNLIRALSSLDSEHEWIVFAQPHLLSALTPVVHRLRMIPTRPMPPPIRLLWEQTALPVWTRRLNVDVLHSPHYTMPLMHPVRQVVTFHDMTFFLYPERHERSKQLFFPLMIRASARRAERLIVPSESTRKDTLQYTATPPAKVVTIYEGVDERFFLPPSEATAQALRRRYSLPDRFVLYVGTLEPRKNVDILLEAFSRLHPHFPDVKLVLAGKAGWNVAATLQRIAQMEHAGQAIWLRHVPAAHLPALYHLAEVFVYPSLYEGFGLPPLESMAAGTPVITTNVSAMPEVVGRAGVLIPPSDIHALVAALQTLLRQPERRRHLAQQGKARARRFSWQRTARQTLQVYEQVACA